MDKEGAFHFHYEKNYQKGLFKMFEGQCYCYVLVLSSLVADLSLSGVRKCLRVCVIVMFWFYPPL